jgi:hypothetical protein
LKKNALYAMSTSRRNVSIIIKYLNKLGNPVARCELVYESSASRRNHALKDVSLPECVPLSVDAKVMLVVSEVVEKGLQNDSVGTIKDIVYDSPDGPSGPRKFQQHPSYVVVNFPNSTISTPLIIG